jgi:cellobionic acid phosphorylase
LFNTGTVSWVYRSIVEGLCGLKGDAAGLVVHPQLPSHWPSMRVRRVFRGATFDVSVTRGDVARTTVVCDGRLFAEARIDDIEAGRTYRVDVTVP